MKKMASTPSHHLNQDQFDMVFTSQRTDKQSISDLQPQNTPYEKPLAAMEINLSLVSVSDQESREVCINASKD